MLAVNNDDSRAQLATMVDGAGYQVFLEVARTDEPTGFIIEDGTATAVEAEATP